MNFYLRVRFEHLLFFASLVLPTSALACTWQVEVLEHLTQERSVIEVPKDGFPVKLPVGDHYWCHAKEQPGEFGSRKLVVWCDFDKKYNILSTGVVSKNGDEQGLYLRLGRPSDPDFAHWLSGHCVPDES